MLIHFQNHRRTHIRAHGTKISGEALCLPALPYRLVKKERGRNLPLLTPENEHEHISAEAFQCSAKIAGKVKPYVKMLTYSRFQH